MCARVYNPETNQFTSPDPVKGGNENSYTYPNDPIANADFTGHWGFWVDLAVGLVITALTAAACGATAGIACPLIVGGVLSAINGAASAGHDADLAGIKGGERDRAVLGGAVTGALANTVTFGLGKVAEPYVNYIADASMLSKGVSKVATRLRVKEVLKFKTRIQTSSRFAVQFGVEHSAGMVVERSIREIESWHHH